VGKGLYPGPTTSGPAPSARPGSQTGDCRPGLPARGTSLEPGEQKRVKSGQSGGLPSQLHGLFLTGQLFFLAVGEVVRDSRGLLARHAEEKRAVYGSLSGGSGLFGRHKSKKNQHRSRESYTHTYFLFCNSDQPAQRPRFRAVSPQTSARRLRVRCNRAHGTCLLSSSAFVLRGALGSPCGNLEPGFLVQWGTRET